MCHFAPGIPESTQMRPTSRLPTMTVTMACQTLRPSEIKDYPVDQPPMLKEPVTTQRPTKVQGPYVRRSGGRGLVSRFMYADVGASSSRGISIRLKKRRTAELDILYQCKSRNRFKKICVPTTPTGRGFAEHTYNPATLEPGNASLIFELRAAHGSRCGSR
jgi:hypothetical protein